MMKNKYKNLEKFNRYLTSLLYKNPNKYSSINTSSINTSSINISCTIQDVVEYLDSYTTYIAQTPNSSVIKLYKEYFLNNVNDVDNYQKLEIAPVHFIDFMISLYNYERSLAFNRDTQLLQNCLFDYLEILENKQFPMLDSLYCFLKTTSTSYLPTKNNSSSYELYFYNVNFFLEYCKKYDIDTLSNDFISSIFPKTAHTSAMVNISYLEKCVDLANLSEHSDNVAQLFVDALKTYKPASLNHFYELKIKVYSYLKKYNRQTEIAEYCSELEQSSFFKTSEKIGEVFSFNLTSLQFQYDLDVVHARYLHSAISGFINIIKEKDFLKLYIPHIEENPIVNLYISTKTPVIELNMDFNSEQSRQNIKNFLVDIIPITFNYICADIKNSIIDFSTDYYHSVISKAHFTNKIDKELNENNAQGDKKHIKKFITFFYYCIPR